MRAILLAAAIGLVSAAQAAPLPDATYMHPGHLVPVDGARKINLVCLGHGSPTVLFDSGLADSTVAWRLVQGEVAKVTRACAYDRAGIGFSDPRTAGESDAKAIVADLHALLGSAKIKTPILYVGHSIAGLYGLLLQATHPDDLAGVVLVDPSFANQFDALWAASIAAGAKPAAGQAILDALHAQTKRMKECAKLKAPLPKDCAAADTRLPPALAAFHLAQESRPSYLITNASEFESFLSQGREKNADQKELEAANANFGDKLLVVLTHGKGSSNPGMTDKQSAAMDRAWGAGHDKLAKLSTRGSNTVVPGSGHNIQHDQPQAVIDAVKKAVAALRAR